VQAHQLFFDMPSGDVGLRILPVELAAEKQVPETQYVKNP
jgi:hypothetical protein